MRISQPCSLLGLLSSMLLLAACERSFDAPPNPIVIDDFEPKLGFFGDSVTIFGSHFAPATEDNIVYFGTESAAIEAVDETGTELRVRVPTLDPDSRVFIKVAATGGQTSSSLPFLYRGHGHPLSEALSRSFQMDSGPVAILPRIGLHSLPDSPLSFPVFEVLVANSVSRTITRVDLLSGERKIMGLREAPDTLAARQNDEGVEVFYSHLSELDGLTQGDVSALQFSFSEITVGANGDDALGPELELNAMAESNLGQIQGSWDASDIEFNDQPFQPGLIQVLALRDGANHREKLVAADRYRAVLMLTDPESLTDEPTGDVPGDVLFCKIPTEMSNCAGSGPTHVADMLPTAQGDLLLTLSGRPELFALSLDQGLCHFELIWPQDTQQRLWPLLPDTFFGADHPKTRIQALVENTACDTSFGALTSIEDDVPERIFVAEHSRKRMIELNYFDLTYATGDPLIGEIHIDSYLPVRSLSTRSPVLAATSAQAISAQSDGLTQNESLLYLVTAEGILYASAGIFLQERGFWSRPGLLSGPRAINTIAAPFDAGDTQLSSEWDWVLFADKTEDRLLVFAAGMGPESAWSIPLGADRPMVTASRFGDILYVSDELTNTVQLIDQRSGLMVDQFFIGAPSEFGPESFACLHQNQEDILVTSTTSRVSGTSLATQTVRLRSATNEHDVMGMSIGSRDGESSGNGVPCNAVDIPHAYQFDSMLSVPRQNRLVLVRLNNPPLAWTTQIVENQESEGGYLITTPDDNRWDDSSMIVFDLPARTKRVSLSPQGDKLLAFCEKTGDAPPTLHNYSLQAQGESFPIPVDEFFAAFTMDIALHTGSAMDVAYLALGDLGMVAAVPLGGVDSSIIHTGNAPSGLFFSPDGRRLYVLHKKLDKLSIIDTDCEPLGACEEVVATIALESSPSSITFHPSGKAAFVSHWNNQTVSIIE